VPGDPRIRASDADRDRAAALLREHHAAGRLTAEEFNERLDAALNAKTLGEIDELLADLPLIDLYKLPHESMRPPAGLPHSSLMPKDPDRPRRFRPDTMSVAAWGAVTSALIALWAILAVVDGGTWYPWWIFIAVAWIIAALRRAQRHRE
jgi:uncharacterized membrane protein